MPTIRTAGIHIYANSEVPTAEVLFVNIYGAERNVLSSMYVPVICNVLTTTKMLWHCILRWFSIEECLTCKNIYTNSAFFNQLLLMLKTEYENSNSGCLQLQGTK